MQKQGSHFRNWIKVGDNFILGYLLTGRDLLSVSLFCIAHAMEAYMKSCVVKRESVDKAIDYKHELIKLFRHLKKDSKFLPEIQIPEKCFTDYSIEFLKPRKHDSDCLKHQHYLLPFKYCADLKYFGAALKKINSPYGFGAAFPEFRYAQFFIGIRKYLEIESDKHFQDSLATALKKELFPINSTEEKFLRGCIGESIEIPFQD